MPKSTRTFIALPIPGPIGQKLVLLQEKLAREVPEIRWVEPAGFHVTLNFLGDVVDTDLHLVCKTVIDVARGVDAFEAIVEGVGIFPNPQRPRVIWAGLRETKNSLAGLHRDLAKSLAAIGYRSDEPRFHPHVTIGRIRNDRKPTGDLAGLIESHRTWTGGSFRARELIVYASNLGPAGPSYTALSHAPLRLRMTGSRA